MSQNWRFTYLKATCNLNYGMFGIILLEIESIFQIFSIFSRNFLWLSWFWEKNTFWNTCWAPMGLWVEGFGFFVWQQPTLFLTIFCEKILVVYFFRVVCLGLLRRIALWLLWLFWYVRRTLVLEFLIKIIVRMSKPEILLDTDNVHLDFPAMEETSHVYDLV